MDNEETLVLDLPSSSEDKLLPLFVPPKTSPRISAPPPLRTPTPIKPKEKTPEPDEDLQALFNEVSEPSSPGFDPSMPLAPVPNRPADPVSLRAADRGSAGAQDDAEQEDQEAPRKAGKFAKGFTSGMQPLDGNQFEVTPAPRKRSDQIIVLRSGPVPMADASRMVRKRFEISLRDVILLVLVVLLACALYLGWTFYQDYSHRAELQELSKRQDMMEKDKQQNISDNMPKKEKDVP
jgi:hypothetical protein